ncbi:MAG: nucleotidyltransferase family protein [Aigarchaeota archaeon]|nr:nucleotidyltransferase family protein [Aigarchaeota archaeon]MDW8092749.1 nucleotidyltransferase family protein [Nitrososphaerota archaeon]
MVKAVVMAGGLGARMRPLSYYIQKSMVPIGRSQYPLIHYIMNNISFHGIKEFVVLVGHKWEQIMNYLGDGRKFGWRVSFVLDREGYSGTGGCLLNAYEMGIFRDDELILVHYGDILTNLNVTELLKRHRDTGADAVLVVSEGYEVPVGVAKIKEGKVVEFIEKPTIPLHVGIGVVTFSANALKLLTQAGRRFDLMGDFIPLLIRSGLNVRGYVTKEQWYDVGSLDKYEKLTCELVDSMFAHIGEERVRSPR